MGTKAAFAVKALNHIVLTVKDIQASVGFYTASLGMTHESHALRFGSQKMNLHLSGHEFEPKATHVQPGSGDLCFLTDHPVDAVLAQWREAGIKVLEGGQVVNRTGAVGKLRSVYCRDPDGNLVEYASGHRAGFPASEAHIEKQGIQLYVARSSVPHKPHNPKTVAIEFLEL